MESFTKKLFLSFLWVGIASGWALQVQAQVQAEDALPGADVTKNGAEHATLESPLVGLELTLMPNLQLYQDGTGLDLLIGVRREIGMLSCDLDDWRKNIVIGGGLIAGYANSPLHEVRNYGFFFEGGYQFELKELLPWLTFLDSLLGARLSAVADVGVTYNTVDERRSRVFNGASFYAAPRAVIDFQLPVYKPIRVGVGISSVVNANAFWSIGSVTLGFFGSYRF